MLDVILLLSELIKHPSVTPNDAGCQTYIRQIMQANGFKIEDFSYENVTNTWITKGDKGPLLVFAGHTDVVASGDVNSWSYPPFKLTNVDGKLYGRGVADMKGAVAAMMLALIEFFEKHPDAPVRLGLLLTSAEEGDDFLKGTPYVMQELAKRKIKIDYCVVGEPSSREKLGDVMKVGRRGSLTGTFDIIGKQGHVAYAHLANNPIHSLTKFLYDLTKHHWDNGNKDFPPTSLQVVEVRSGGLGTNVIPSEAHVQFNLRFSSELKVEQIQSVVENILNKYDLKYRQNWLVKGLPFYTQNQAFLSTMQQAVFDVTHIKPEPSTDGGTSDARFIAPYGIPVIEFGLLNNTIHQIDEHIGADDLIKLKNIYLRMCELIVI
jgi:succinyl-diaminopimelate desuccinylase